MNKYNFYFSKTYISNRYQVTNVVMVLNITSYNLILVTYYNVTVLVEYLQMFTVLLYVYRLITVK